ncbi:MAG: hypothetical protein MJ135_07935 [Oscillospiraceae bacterium]|nr:hypothetical protein [Oscillospiraceae bacterium]
MIDFHSHVLPGIDDGSKSVGMSLRMLEESFRLGIDHMVATPHFDANETSPSVFLAERQRAAEQLLQAVDAYPQVEFPQLTLGAEVLYFPGISVAEEIAQLRMGNSPCILIEPPMKPWTRQILDEIEQMGRNFQLVPVIAHVDRYMRLLKDETLLERVLERRMLVQVNASYFLYRESRARAIRDLQNGKLHFLGSDCHNMDRRRQNLHLARETIQTAGAEAILNALDAKGRNILGIE